jgi:ribosomal subunit interface protein
MEIIVRGRHVTVPARFRQHAVAKLSKLEKLDQKVTLIDVEVSEERNPRQSAQRERIELTIRSRGPAIRAEAAAVDRYAALDLALAKLNSRLRRAADRRKASRGAENVPARLARVPEEAAAGAGHLDGEENPPAQLNGGRVARPRTGVADDSGAEVPEAWDGDHMIPIEMEGDGPLVLREKVHVARPMSIDQALFEMELVGHDFYLFHDRDCDRFSVVYRRRGYDYGVIRLVEE